MINQIRDGGEQEDKIFACVPSCFSVGVEVEGDFVREEKGCQEQQQKCSNEQEGCGSLLFVHKSFLLWIDGRIRIL